MGSQPEVERKFLVPSGLRALVPKDLHSVQIRQGYLSYSQDIRIRLLVSSETPVADHPALSSILAAKFTFKTGEGLSRIEDERQMNHRVALRAYEYSVGEVVKTRRIFVDPQRPDEKWEIDFYHGRHEGLVVAECEASLETIQSVQIPAFCGDEVTGVVKFSNRSLALR